MGPTLCLSVFHRVEGQGRHAQGQESGAYQLGLRFVQRRSRRRFRTAAHRQAKPRRYRDGEQWRVHWGGIGLLVMAALQFTYLKSRLGRRVAGLFVICALLPLSVATFFLAAEFDAQLTHNQEQDLDAAARGYGQALLGRLGSADDVLRALAVSRG